ncbi:MAG: putative Ig domain-containing protein, partial [Betaproteobacteria bacterium]
MNGNAGLILFKGSANYGRDLLSLALYIGQIKRPSFTVANNDPALAMRVRSGSTGSKNIYPVILANGGTPDNLTGGAAKDSNGMTTGNPGIALASSNFAVTGATNTMNYNVIYSSAAKTQGGTDSFTVTVNSAASASASRTIAVTVLGINNASVTATAIKGQNYPSLYTATCNGCVANSFLVDPATPLPAGLGMSAAGVISGTPSTAPGAVPVTLSATSSGATDSGDGMVQRDITITVHGITNAPPGYTQGTAIASDYVVGLTAGATPTGVNPFDLTPLPAGFTFDRTTGHLNGTPTLSGDFVVTISANTNVGLLSQTATIHVTSAGAPVVTSTPALSTSLAAPTLIGTVGQAISNIQINASNPPIDANSYAGSGLPSGVTVAAGSGVISGTPAPGQSGVFTLNLSAKNNGGTMGTGGPFYVQVNPATAPVVSGTHPPNANVGSAFPVFSVAASNGPISAYAVAAGALPAGLSLNATSGAITGTPTASGVFKTSFTATNVVATSVPVELTFTVISNVKPAITSPTFASFPAGVAITPIQIQASNPVITAYKQTGLPAGLQLDTVTGIISGTPTTPGNFTVKLAADNGAPGPAFGAERDVVFTIGIPAPAACAMSVPLNTATTLDLASCLFAGFAPTGASIVATPAHGTATVSGTKVTYTPVNNYFGADTFTFVGSGLGGNSPQGTVTVTVTGRPDPAQDATVAALLTAQVDAAQRFARAQISNFQHRMESLHRGPGTQGNVGASLLGRVDTPAVIGLGGNSSLLSGNLAPVNPQTPGGITAMAANHSPTIAGGSEVLAALAAGAGVQAMPLAESVVSLVKNRSVNLSGVASGLGLNANPATGSAAGNSYWVEGVAT